MDALCMKQSDEEGSGGGIPLWRDDLFSHRVLLDGGNKQPSARGWEQLQVQLLRLSSLQMIDACSYVVAINVIFFAYSTWQLILLGQVAEYGTSSTYDKLLSTYVFDQMLAFLLFSSSSAAATVAQLSHRGIHSIWPPACSTWSLASFCSRANAAVVLSFFSSLFAVVSFALSSYNLAKYMR